MIDGQCVDGCTSTMTYAYKIYFTYESNLTSSATWQSLDNTDGLASGNFFLKKLLPRGAYFNGMS